MKKIFHSILKWPALLLITFILVDLFKFIFTDLDSLFDQAVIFFCIISIIIFTITLIHLKRTIGEGVVFFYDEDEDEVDFKEENEINKNK